jgi:hypothetical protein
MDLAGAGRFVEQGLATIPGWLDKFDARVFLSIQETQREAAVTGDVLEIGVYLGRSAVLLGYFVRPHERFIVCDLFLMSEMEGSDPAQRLSAFRANYLRFHQSLPDIRVGLSSQLIDERADAFRFIHVDGSHNFEEVANDIRIVRRLATSDAVVVFDDVRTREWPGVAAAVWAAVANQTIIPFAMTNKLYCTIDDRPEYLESIIRTTRATRSFRTAIHPIAGHDVIALSPTPEPAARRFIRELTPPALLRLDNRLSK